MKHIFVLNPVAGKGKAEKVLLPRIIEAAKNAGINYEIHRTINVGEATTYVRSKCEEEPGEALRFYAVGGDGTISEVVNGLVGFENAEMAVIPSGSGNDFCRMFGSNKDFLNLDKQFNGTSRAVDLICYNGRYSVNMLNIGLDCAAAEKMAYYKENTVLGGTAAYVAGLLNVVIKNAGAKLKIRLDDGRVFDEEFTLLAIGNGAFCGGGFKGVPNAHVNDGLLDVSMIRKVTRLDFLQLVGKYHNGTHLDSKLVQKKDLVTYAQCKSLVLHTEPGTPICCDGEILHEEELQIDLIPQALRFVVPQGCEDALVLDGAEAPAAE
ncbi:MAG: diacylglycerol kinase family lipid kinase [Clostridiales bacterium]|nr:diacylglycerol kinase family lipid kinase [Clostridiales bacterium]